MWKRAENRAAGGLGLVVCNCLLVLVLQSIGCTSARDARFAAAVERENPPTDFQLGVTVQAPMSKLGARAVITPARDGRPATQTYISNTPYGQRGVATIPISHRPARYVFEADWILRTAIGVGARESNFPTQTRQLTPGEVQQLWTMMRESGLMASDHPAIVSSPPEPEDVAGRTAYIVSYQVAGLRRTLVIDAGLPPVEGVVGANAAGGSSAAAGAAKEGAAAGAGGTPANAPSAAAPAVVPVDEASAAEARKLIDRLAALSWQS